MEWWNPSARDSDRFPEEDNEPVEEFCPQCLQPYRSEVDQPDEFYAAAAAPPAPPPAPPARPRRAIPRWQRAPVPRVANVAPKAVAQAPIRAQVAPLNRRRPVVPVVAANQRAAQNYAVARGGPIGSGVRDLDRINRRGRPVPIPDRPRWRY